MSSSAFQIAGVQVAPQASGVEPSADARAHRERLLALCLRGMTLTVQDRLDELMEMYADDCELHLNGGAAFSPWFGVYHGKEAVRTKLREGQTLFDALDFRPRDFRVVGDTVILHAVSLVRNRGTGPARDVDGVMVLKFRGDQCYYSGQFVDTAALAVLADLPAPDAD
jgi:ketosteroid isomerase-like protein